ncbi:MAG: hypothetical protein ABSF66_03450 [Terriglobales bacterium]|jgi:hypothetical protein
MPVTGKLTVSGDDPRQAGSPLFANFVAISHVGAEVQFEFIFLDLNQLAHRIDRVKAGQEDADGEMQGKTIGKVIVPVVAFLQLKDHLLPMFKRLEEINETQPQKTGAEREYGD